MFPPPPPPQLLTMIMSSRYGMLGTIQYDGSFSDPLPIRSGVKQGCVLAPTLFGIFFSLLLRYAFHESEDGIFLLRYAFISQKMVSSSTFHESKDGIFLHTRRDSNLFIISRLRAKTKMHPVLIREILFADDAALATHSAEALQ